MKSPDWIQELYLKELVYNKHTNGEKTHDKDRPNAEKIKGTPKGNRGIPNQMQTRKTAD